MPLFKTWGLQQALERLTASGIAEDQARRLLGLV